MISILVGATAYRHQSSRPSFEDERSIFSQCKMHGRYGQRWTSHGASLTDPRRRNQRCIAAGSKPVLSHPRSKTHQKQGNFRNISGGQKLHRKSLRRISVGRLPLYSIPVRNTGRVCAIFGYPSAPGTPK
ncbi:uncharacterized protein ARMOST_14967 [Armillaria ostoyae]|uniref:Uncharacterized protein n=1 Tax=Armillaria ostoyae TaxID=47428 RepID=A0A284RS21_ARMOS|nr:uncharacterized protein ARMOST_14967 [Armillaria ostoyae]